MMSNREKTLGLCALAMVCIGILFIVVIKLRNWRSEISTQADELAIRQAEADELLRNRDLWTQRGAHLKSTLPPFPGRSDADTNLINQLKDSAESNELTITKRRLLEPEDSEFYSSAICEIHVAGEFGKIGKWLTSNQTTSNFLDIRDLRLTADRENPQLVNCAVLVIQYFQIQSAPPNS